MLSKICTISSIKHIYYNYNMFIRIIFYNLFLFNYKNFFYKKFNNGEININIYFLKLKNYFSYKAPILNLNFKTNMFILLSDLQLKKKKNYLQLKFVHFENIWNYQFDNIYLKTINKKFFDYLSISEVYKLNYINYICSKFLKMSLFEFFRDKLVKKICLKKNNTTINSNYLKISEFNDSKRIIRNSSMTKITEKNNFNFFFYVLGSGGSVYKDLLKIVKNFGFNCFLTTEIWKSNFFFKKNKSLFFNKRTFLNTLDDIFFFFNFSLKSANFVDKWRFSLSYLYKPGYFFFISDQSSFLNFIFTFLRQNSGYINSNKWLDRGFFFPIEVSLTKFYFSYYSNFFFNFFESSTFINLNNNLYKYNLHSYNNEKSKLSSIFKIFIKKKNKQTRTLVASQKFLKNMSNGASLIKNFRKLSGTSPISIFRGGFFKFLIKKSKKKVLKSYLKEKILHEKKKFKKIYFKRYDSYIAKCAKTDNFKKFVKFKKINFKFIKKYLLPKMYRSAEFWRYRRKWVKQRFFKFTFRIKRRVKLRKIKFYQLWNQRNYYVFLKSKQRRRFLKKKYSIAFRKYMRTLDEFFSIRRRIKVVKYNYIKSGLKKKKIKDFFFKNIKLFNGIFQKKNNNKAYSTFKNILKMRNLRFRDYFNSMRTRILKRISNSNKFNVNNKKSLFYTRNFLNVESYLPYSSIKIKQRVLGHFNSKFLNYSQNINTNFLKFNYNKSNVEFQKLLFNSKFIDKTNQNNTVNDKFNATIYRSLLKKKSRILQKSKRLPLRNIIFRMKPGYSVIWRMYRKEYVDMCNLSYYRQRRVSNFFLNFKKQNNLYFFKIFEFMVFSLVKRSNFFFGYGMVNMMLKLGLVFVNGISVVDRFFQVFVGERVQIIINYKLFIQYKWLFYFHNFKKIYFLSKYIKNFFSINKSVLSLRRNSLNFSKKWFKKIIFCNNDVPNFLEVDYFTMISVVVYQPFLIYEFDYTVLFRVPFMSLQLYNWKYIN